MINPLRSMYAEEFSVAPLTAMVDPRRVQSYLDHGEPDFPEEVRYIFRRQVEEADLIALSKADTLEDAEVSRLVDELEERVGDRPVFPVSARTGRGIEPWLSLLVDSDGTSGVGGDAGLDIENPIGAEDRALTDIDYDTYADGEAKLGWVNTTVDLAGPFDVSAFRDALMERLREALGEAGIEVAHLKFSIAAEGTLCRGNLTATDADPRYGGADPGTVPEGRLVFNARAVGDPESIRTITRNAIDGAASRTGADATVTEEQAFRPEYPEPAHRMTDGPKGAGSTQSD